MKKLFIGLFIVVGLVLTGYGGYMYLTSEAGSTIIKKQTPSCVVHIHQHGSKTDVNVDRE